MERVNKKQLGDRIRELRTAAGHTQDDLAELLDQKRQVVSYYENGTRMPNIEQIMTIAKEYNTTTDYLLGLTETATELKTEDSKALRICCDYTGLTEKAISELNFAKYCVDSYKKENSNLWADYVPLLNFINDYIVFITEDEQRYNLFSYFNCGERFSEQIKVLTNKFNNALLEYQAAHLDTEERIEKNSNMLIDIYNELFELNYAFNAQLNGTLFSISQDLTNLLKKNELVYKIPNDLNSVLNALEDILGIPKT